jgi:hypothetical protein
MKKRPKSLKQIEANLAKGLGFTIKEMREKFFAGELEGTLAEVIIRQIDWVRYGNHFDLNERDW